MPKYSYSQYSECQGIDSLHCNAIAGLVWGNMNKLRGSYRGVYYTARDYWRRELET